MGKWVSGGLGYRGEKWCCWY